MLAQPHANASAGGGFTLLNGTSASKSWGHEGPGNLEMVDTSSFNCLILRAVRQMSTVVIGLARSLIRWIYSEFHHIFRAILGWDGDPGYIGPSALLMKCRLLAWVEKEWRDVCQLCDGGPF